jgi:hypothetical protein
MVSSASASSFSQQSHLKSYAVIVPNDLTLFEIKERFFNQGSGKAVMGPRIFTIQSLEARLADDLKIDLISPYSKEFILTELTPALWKALNIPGQITSGKLSELSAELGDALDRIRVSGLPYEELEKIEPLSISRVLASILRDFEKNLAPFDDRPSMRRKIINALKAGKSFDFLKGIKDLYFVCFQRLSPFETDFVKALALTIRVHLYLSFPEWLGDTAERVRAGFLRQRLLLDIESSGLDNLSMEPYADIANLSLDIPGLDDTLVIRDERIPKALAYASKHLFGPDPKKWREKQKVLDPGEKYPPDLEDPDTADSISRDAITIVEAPNIYMETEAAVRIIKNMIVSGSKPHSLALVVPDLKSFLPQIEDVGRRFGLSFHHRRGTPLEMIGPVKAFFELFYLFGSLFERTRVIRLLLSPYFNFGLRYVPISELISAGLIDDRGDAGFFSERVRNNRNIDDDCWKVFKVVDRLKEIETELMDSPTWKDFFFVLDSCLSEFSWPNLKNKVPRLPKTWDKEVLPEERLIKIHEVLLAVLKRDEAGKAAFLRQYEALKKAFLEDPRAPKSPSLEEFDGWLMDAVSGAYVKTPGADNPMGKVRLLNYYDLHGAFFEGLFLLGLNENSFPKGSAEGAFWPKKFVESFNLTTLKRSLWHNPLERYHEEEEIIQGALNQTKKAYLFYSEKNDANKATNPSHFISSLMALWPGGELSPKNMSSLGLLSPPRGDLTAEENELRLYLLSLSEKRRWEIIKQLDLKLPDLIPRNISIPRATEHTVAREVINAFIEGLPKYPGPKKNNGKICETGPLLDVGFFTDYHFCPRYFWYQRILKLTYFPEESEVIHGYDTGTIFHKTLEKFLDPLVGKTGSQIDKNLISKEKFEEIFYQVASDFREINAIGRDLVFDKEIEKLKENLFEWLERQNGFKDANILHLEWSFGARDGDDKPLKIKSSKGVFYLNGRIDRIDRSKDGNYVIKDYKLSISDKYRLDPNRADEPDAAIFPMLMYSMAVKRNLCQKSEDIHAIFEFIRKKKSKEPYIFQCENILGVYKEPEKIFSTIYENILSGVITPISNNNCETCSFVNICNFKEESDE